MRIFYVIYITDEILSPYLNAIRYIGNPDEKYNAHITVRGPYQKHLVKILNSHLINFEFKANRLLVLQSIKGQTDYRVRLEYLKTIFKKELTFQEIEGMSEIQRLNIIDKITEHISFIKTKKKLEVRLIIDEEYKSEFRNFDLNVLRETPEETQISNLLNDKKLVLTILRES